MTVNDYEAQGGFKEELAKIREIGMALTPLEEILPTRPHREPERTALRKLRAALDLLRDEICTTRSMGL